MDCSMPGFPVLHYLLEFVFKLMSIELVMPPNHLILCRPLLLPPSIFPSIRVLPTTSLVSGIFAKVERPGPQSSLYKTTSIQSLGPSFSLNSGPTRPHSLQG